MITPAEKRKMKGVEADSIKEVIMWVSGLAPAVAEKSWKAESPARGTPRKFKIGRASCRERV